MAKNPRRLQQKTAAKVGEAKPNRRPLLSRRGKKCFAPGAGLVILGFWILTLTDPAGQNWASTLSPALLVAGYGLIGIAIVLRDPIESAAVPTAAPEA